MSRGQTPGCCYWTSSRQRSPSVSDVTQAERIPNPDDKRSYLVSLTKEGRQLLAQARPRFRAFAEAVEARLGGEQVGGLRGGLAELREAIEAQLNSG